MAFCCSISRQSGCAPCSQPGSAGRDAATRRRGLGLAPPSLAAAIEAIQPDTLDLAGLGERRTAGPTIPSAKAVQKLLVELEVAFHKGATTQDILICRCATP